MNLAETAINTPRILTVSRVFITLLFISDVESAILSSISLHAFDLLGREQMPNCIVACSLVLGLLLGGSPYQSETTFRIDTLAGADRVSFAGDGGPASAAVFSELSAVAVDNLGNIYVADSYNNRVRKIGADGVIRTVAGTGVNDYGGDSGSGVTTNLSRPDGLALDSNGNLYISDRGNNVVRKLTPAGSISIFAGREHHRRAPADDFDIAINPATEAALSSPTALATDQQQNLYIADQRNEVIRKVTPDGTITVVAGTGDAGFNGDDRPAKSAQLSNPNGLAVDSAGNLYIADENNHRIRMVDSTGKIRTIAGTGVRGNSGDGHPALHATLSAPTNIAIDKKGNLFFTDSGNARVRRINTNQVICTVACEQVTPYTKYDDDKAYKYFGDGVGRINGPNGRVEVGCPAVSRHPGDGSKSCQQPFRGLSAPQGLATDSSGNLYVVDSGNSQIYRLSPGGEFSTIAGLEYSKGDGGPADKADLSSPWGVAVDSAGSVYVSENGAIRKITRAGIISTIAGAGAEPRGQDIGPTGIACDQAGNVFFADNATFTIKKISPAGVITTVAGNGVRGVSRDGGAALSSPLSFWEAALAIDREGNLYFTETYDRRVRKVTPGGRISTVAGNGRMGFSGDGGPAKRAMLSLPVALAVDLSGTLYIADEGSHTVRKVTPNGVISSVTAPQIGAFSGDGGPAKLARLNNPSGVAVDHNGNLYIADTNNHRIRMVTPDGIITTIAGTGIADLGGDGGDAKEAFLSTPLNLATDTGGNIYVVDSDNYRVRRLTPQRKPDPPK